MLNKKSLKHLLTSLMGFAYMGVLAQHNHDNKPTNTYFFKENKGQWNSEILFKANLSEGAMFLENDGITYHFQDKSWIRNTHGTVDPPPPPKTIKGHAIKASFLGSNATPTISTDRSAPHYENYFLGNDKSKWASYVKIYNEVTYSNLYNFIDFKIYEQDANIKYDFIVHPGGKTNNIKIKYQGAEDVYLENGILYVKTTLTDVIENRPYSYQIINDKKIEVPSKFVLRNKILSFDFPEGYDKNYELIIDPFLVFSTYSGSTADNFGFTATYDTLGFTYGGGIVYGTGYPTTLGAYDSTFNGTGAISVDIGITKYNLNGTGLIYSTYLGGTAGDAPHSLVTNDAGELFIYGTTGSNNYPTTTGCYDNTFNGGSNLMFTISSVQYGSGSDIVLTRLNAAGSAILGSTYLGGTGNDGLNLAAGLKRNYGDEFRGEIIVDDFNNVYINSVTASSNFPTVNGRASHGGYDAVFVKMNSNLSTILYSTHFGGTGSDAGYGLQNDAAGNLFITGGTNSTTLDSVSNTFNGTVDGYLAKYSPAGAIMSSRYIGTTLYDQTYFVQVDITDSIYVLGQSNSALPVTAGKYSNTGGRQFIQKFSNDLSVMEYSTIVGSGRSSPDFSPSAFLVNDCGLIYLCGWGGSLVGSGSSTTGLPITPGAFQTTTNGTDFYLMVLDEDATGLNYATFFGGGVSAEHVDGGTSRFDKKGNVYQAVCAGCGGRNDFPTSTGAWSTTNGSTNCNLGVFKFNINEVKASASVPTATICFPSSTTFGNNSLNGNTYLWTFGDGTTSSLFAPSHTYAAAGTYTVVLTVSDSTGCIKPDTASINLVVFDPALAVTSPDTIICPGASAQLRANGGTSYLWSPAATLSNPTIQNPIASPIVPTTYQIIVTNPCGQDTSYVNVGFHTIATSISNDTTICSGDTANILATGGGSYLWTQAASLTNASIGNPGAFPTTTTTYTTSITTPDGCLAQESLIVTVIYDPTPTLSADDSICFGDTKTLIATGADTYSWSPSASLSASTGSSVIATPPANTTYYVDYTNSCTTLRDSVFIAVVVPQAFSAPNDTICFNELVLVWASGGVSYSWSPAQYVTSPTNDSTFVDPPTPTNFRVIVTDNVGCTDTAFTYIGFSPVPTINAGPNQIINFGEVATLSATSSPGTFSWAANKSLGCPNCKTTVAQPGNTTTYIATLADPYGCFVYDTVTIFLEGSLYVPNSFTPNGDGINDEFVIISEDITNFSLMIFNRWGELLYESTDIEESWDGTYKGKLSQIDTYIWKIRYSDVNKKSKDIYGHVNLIR